MVKSMLVLSVVAFICLAATILVIMLPSDLGAPYEPLKATDSYLFDPWEFSLGGLHISYPEGGTLIGAYRSEELTALVLLAEGVVHYYTEDQEETMQVQQIILHMHPSEIALLRGQTYIEATILPDALLEAQQLLLATAGGEPTLEVFGVKKVFLPRPGVARLAMFGDGSQHSYTYARKTILSGPLLNDQYLRPEAPMYPSNDQFIYSLAVIFLMVLAVTVGLVFVTPDYAPRDPEPQSLAAMIWPLVLLTTHIAVETYLATLKLSPMVTWGWRVMVVASALWLADMHGDGLSFLGLKPSKPFSGIGTGILSGFLLFLCGSIALPGGIISLDYMELLGDFLPVLVTSIFFQELLWRGLLQGTLRKHFSAVPGILLTTILFSCASFVPTYISGLYSTEALLHSFFIIPMTSLVLGVAYERTGNLLTPITTLSVLYVLPRILHF